METTYANKCNILAEVWLDYRGEEDFNDFVEYCDLGLPLAFSISQNIIESSPQAELYINEAFDLLLEALDIKEDMGFDTIDDVLMHANK
jgi:hypothetical protein